MNWLTNFVRPKIKALVGGKPDVPDNMWHKCPGCTQMIFHRDLTTNRHVCPHCDHHLRMPLLERMDMLFDNSAYNRIELPKVVSDPLKFRDRKRYTDRLKEARHATGEDDAVIVAHGKIGGSNAVIAGLNFDFMAGSMGTAVGEGIIAAARLAVVQKAPLIVIPASGGARMQESILSLMQMPRTTVAVQEVKEAGLPYIVLLTDPTTGGVSASFAMLGDIQIAEPGCLIGFAGRRVIEQTVREVLPDGFQTAEYLYDHGMIDMVVSRPELKDTLSGMIDLIMNPKPSGEVLPLTRESIEEHLEIPEEDGVDPDEKPIEQPITDAVGPRKAAD
ncbi:acetyl-CoA carboxylase, carboxyltransferase subunit beta [Aestuariispira insulae]|uniref:Acetyl-coenzyme A carboxylase carboxyl transferase subunit beta n=1 Tax=Aestuariispira insulae TaxID=1461337 RepID=A0A3D9HPM3_9PROT|nr:acetyl-CoA carboxylase, carboxyltransferase subunit beta [Aestuariispira insulae]RED51463.1 acetyl-CoA carboxylase carboxyltransferase subunit alpha [Aestuariispira insulae]